jgi:hypothetical protein
MESDASYKEQERKRIKLEDEEIFKKIAPRRKSRGYREEEDMEFNTDGIYIYIYIYIYVCVCVCLCIFIHILYMYI